MSFWLFGRRREGRRWLYSVGVHWPMLWTLVALILALLLPLVAWLRAR